LPGSCCLRAKTVANMTKRALAVGGIRTPLAIRKLRSPRSFEAVAVSRNSLADPRNHRRDFTGQPAMAGCVFRASAVEIEMKFDNGCAPAMHRSFDHGWLPRVIGRSDIAIGCVADRRDGGEICILRRRWISRNAMKKRDIRCAAGFEH